MPGNEEKTVQSEAYFWPQRAVVGEIIYPPGSTFGPRRQPNLQLVLVHSGHLDVEIDGKVYSALANSVFVLYPGHTEHFTFAQECETWHTWLHAEEPEMNETFLARLQRLEWSLPLSPAMHQFMRDALVMQSSRFPVSAEMLRAQALQMFWRYIGEGEERLAPQTQHTSLVVEQAKQFIDEHLAHPLTLENIASSVAISPAHLIRLFQAQQQTTPIAYLWQRRVARGIELLEQTGLTVGIIALRCGFQSRFHFSRRVREAVGYSPVEIRKRLWRRV